ncbi:MAG TPA: hypothetical protein VG328_22625 [Stellaceae bacterium]|jgi:hypothetical protein|nr:hypothetical protein [Stellaceae bacterium]
MAFRNSVKVTLLSPESENARPYPAQPAFLLKEPSLAEQIARTPQEVAPPVSNDSAPTPAPATDIDRVEEISAAAMWHERADELRAMTDTLPSAITRGLMPKIIALYDSFARAEGWSDTRLEQHEPAAPEAPLPDELLLGECAEEFPDDDAPLSHAAPEPAWLAFARRPLPSPRRRSIRR